MSVFGGPVVRLDLGGVTILLKPERLDEAAADRQPVRIRVGNVMSVVVANRPVELAEYRDPAESLFRPLQAVGDIHELFADGRRAGRLAVGPRKHRHCRVGLREPDDAAAKGLHCGAERFASCRTEHQGIAEIIDVFRGAGKMQEVLEAVGLRALAEPFADEILDGLDVVIRCRFDRLDSLRVVERELVDEVVEHVFHDGRERGEFADSRFVGETLQPADLYQHAVADQAVLAQDVTKAVSLPGIAPVHGGKGSEGR